MANPQDTVWIKLIEDKSAVVMECWVQRFTARRRVKRGLFERRRKKRLLNKVFGGIDVREMADGWRILRRQVRKEARRAPLERKPPDGASRARGDDGDEDGERCLWCRRRFFG